MKGYYAVGNAMAKQSEERKVTTQAIGCTLVIRVWTTAYSPSPANTWGLNQFKFNCISQKQFQIMKFYCSTVPYHYKYSIDLSRLQGHAYSIPFLSGTRVVETGLLRRGKESHDRMTGSGMWL